MTTKTNTRKTSPKASPKAKAVNAPKMPTMGEVAQAWVAHDEQDTRARSAKREGVALRLPIGLMALALDAEHGNAQDANDHLRTDLGERIGESFTWRKARVSQARNLARGYVALFSHGVDVREDVDALASLGTAASNLGAEKMAALADAVKATLDGEDAPAPAKAIRDAVKALKATPEQEDGPAQTADGAALEQAVSILDGVSEGRWDTLNDDEKAALAVIVKRLEALAHTVGQSLTA